MFKAEDQEFALKPMNCPGHCLMFDHELRSFRDLPMRYADFGVLHRNELSGALGGLTRLRRFQQDDAHIFCRQDQIESEVDGVLEFMQTVYKAFGFSFHLQLSTRPEKRLGEEKLWDEAEKSLESSLKKCGQAWDINKGDGAFYGPKIDVQVSDALNRRIQCATIQLDFQLPIRFHLKYKASDGSFQRPVMVHRAILGSVERMIAILCEHTAGDWPFWLSPRQAIVIPVSPSFFDYAREIFRIINDAGYFTEIDESHGQFPKKMRDGFMMHHNYLVAVGSEEMANRTVTLTSHDRKLDTVTMPIADMLNLFAQNIRNYL